MYQNSKFSENYSNVEYEIKNIFVFQNGKLGI